jgi:hypothetical protein
LLRGKAAAPGGVEKIVRQHVAEKISAKFSEQIVLGGKVIVKGAPSDPGLIDDLLYRDVLYALFF